MDEVTLTTQDSSSPLPAPVKLKVSKKKINIQTNRQYAPFLFKNRRVFIKLQNPTLQNTVQTSLMHVGAQIINQSPFLAEICISDQPINFNDPSLVKSRGAKLATRASSKQKPPIFIPLQTILWAKEKPIAKNAPYMIIADSEGRYRPLQGIIHNQPQLYLQTVPKGYTLSPFTVPPDDISSVIKKQKQMQSVQPVFVDGPQNAGYCEVCGENFAVPENHRHSAKHQASISDPKWAEFDEISEEINESFFDTTQSSPAYSPLC